jgi:hypothetical protein
LIRVPTTPRKRNSPLPTSSTIDRNWIGAEFPKGIDIERSLAANAKARGESPPDPSLAVLYCEIAAADERHVATIETIATRYGHTPSRSPSGGVGETLGRIRDKVAGMGSSLLDCLSHDLETKAQAIHWHTAWVRAFESIGDAESSRELAVVLIEEKTHHEALQQGLDRMIEQHARGEALS